MIANNTIHGNSAEQGGGIDADYSCCTITNNTIAGNFASTGGGIRFASPAPPALPFTPVMTNNIVAFNTSGILNVYSTPVLRRNCVYSPDGANYTSVNPGVSDVSVEPRLLAVEYGDVHLVSTSPCIDTGDDSALQLDWLDMDQSPRSQGAHVDIGADEFNGTTPPFSAKIIRVRPSGLDANDGSTWALAKRTVQAGVDAAASFGGGDVWVAAGTYTERITLKSQTQVYGGFDGTESDRNQRNWAMHVGILDGGSSGSVVSVLTGHRSNGIDGFTIRSGTGRVSGSSTNGGGIYCSLSSPRIANNRIMGNSAAASGGGIYSYRAWPQILNNVIAGNGANAGGGIACVGSPASILNNTIVANTATNGGGIYCDSNGTSILNNIVAFNSSGVTLTGTSGSVTLRNNCVYNTFGPNYSGLSQGTGDLTVDPDIVAVGYGEVHLRPQSPCINSGDNTTVQPGWMDMDGEPRLQNARVDIGADEFNGVTPVFTPHVVRVSPSGDDANDGSSWAKARRTVQAGVERVFSDGGGQVWVAAGTYPEKITLKVWTYIYGGFAGDENAWDQRNGTVHVTTLKPGAGMYITPVTALPGSGMCGVDGFTITHG